MQHSKSKVNLGCKLIQVKIYHLFLKPYDISGSGLEKACNRCLHTEMKRS